MRLTGWPALLLLLLAFPVVARASSIIESVSIAADLALGATAPTTSFAAFNPALGTLTDMSVDLSGSVNYTGSASSPGTGLFLLDQSGSILQTIFFPAYGVQPFSLGAATGSPFVLAEYSGVGLRDFVVYSSSGTGGDNISINGSGTVTYDYTPTAVPEPSSLFLLGTGLVGLGGIVRRKLLS